MNGVLAQIGGGTRNKFDNKGHHGNVNKFDSIMYCYFIYNYVEHKIYDYPHKYATRLMFKEKVMAATPRKENIVVNMVLQVTISSQILENVIFKDKPLKNKSLVDW